MMCITVANMRRGVLLHKLILVELFLGIWNGFYIFFNNPIYVWWQSTTAIGLIVSWFLHNVISWIKIKPFLSKRASWIFISTVMLIQPFWIMETYANWCFFHNINDLFVHTRPYEALCRDPWWIFTTAALFYNIKKRYELTIPQIVSISPRFGILLGAMILSIIFVILDVCAVTGAFTVSLADGLNPFWQLAFVFKCLTDSILLDDFKTALDRLSAYRIGRIGRSTAADINRRSRGNGQLEDAWNAIRVPNSVPDLPSPDGDYLHGPRWQKIKTADHVEYVRRRRDLTEAESDEYLPNVIIQDIDPHREDSDSHILRP